MSEALYLPFDCESGGIGTDVSLLSVHFAACDKDFNIIDELNLLLKSKEVDDTGSTLYRVTASSLAINNINLIEHDKVALHPSKAGQELRQFLWRNSNCGKIKLMPVGKNIGGDVKWVNGHLLGAKTWSEFVSYRHYDITTIVTFLKRKGKLTHDAPESLS